MKRTVILAAGLMALGVAIYVGKVWAQTGSHPATAAPQSKIALVNFTYIVKKYEKFQVFQEELKTTAAPFRKIDMECAATYEAIYKEQQAPATTPERREAIEKQIKDLKRQVEDNKAAATKALGKKQEEGVRTLYMTIYDVVKRVADSRGIELVLQFNDALEQQDYWGSPNIMRKMQTAPCTPMYYTNGLDISADVVTTLNSQYKASAPHAAAPVAR